MKEENEEMTILPLVPQLFPAIESSLFDTTQFDLANFDADIILDICRTLFMIEQVHFLLPFSTVSHHLEVRVLLFQLIRGQKTMERVLGHWQYWMRWENRAKLHEH